MDSKRLVFERYKFALCFENAQGVAGYITEKVFDAFLGSCVPIYWGAPDIANFVPENCFIDFGAYGSFEKLYKRLVDISNAEYLAYLENIERFLRSQIDGRFSAGRNAENMALILTAPRPHNW